MKNKVPVEILPPGPNLDLDCILRKILDSDPAVDYQYQEAIWGGRRNIEPEKELMLAVLEDAVGLLKKSSVSCPELKETELWIGDEEADGIFSFNNICEVRGFSPQRMREALLPRFTALIRRKK